MFTFFASKRIAVLITADFIKNKQTKKQPQNLKHFAKTQEKLLKKTQKIATFSVDIQLGDWFN